jgi:hypothetical protein
LTVRIIQQTINKGFGTGTQALIETLSAAIGLSIQQYTPRKKSDKRTVQILSFVGTLSTAPNKRLRNRSRRHHFQIPHTQALEDLRTLTATDWQFTFLLAMAPTATCRELALVSSLVPEEPDSSLIPLI